MAIKRSKGSTLLKIAGSVAALILVAIVVIPFVVDANQFRPVLESKFSDGLGRTVKVGNLKISLLSGSLAADDISIADDPKFGTTPFVRAQSFQVGVEMKPLLFSRVVNVTSISLLNPEVTLVRSLAGEWNFSALGAGRGGAEKGARAGEQSNSMSLSVGSLDIRNGRVTIVRGGKGLKPYLLEKVNVTAKNISFQSVFPFNLTADLPGGGKAKLEGKAGPMNGADLLLTPLEASFSLSHFDAVGSGFVDPSAGFGGLLDFDCTMVSDGREVRTKGRAGVDRLKLMQSGVPSAKRVALDYVLRHDLNKQSGVLEETEVTFGKAAAHLGGRYDVRGNDLVLHMKLRGEAMPVEDLEALLPAAGIVLPRSASLQGGTLSILTDTEGPFEKMVTTGTVDLSGTRLTGYDLGAQLATVASLVGIKTGSATDIEKLASAVQITPSGIKVSGFQLIAPTLGQLTGDGVVGSDRSLDFKMVARVAATGGLAGGLARLAGRDTISVPFFIRGTTENPKFMPDVKGAAGGLLGTSAGKPGSAENSLGGILKDLLGKKKK